MTFVDLTCGLESDHSVFDYTVKWHSITAVILLLPFIPYDSKFMPEIE